MKKLTLFSAVLAALTLSGCLIYLDNPPVRHISGQVIREDTGAPIANVSVSFHSGRKPFSLLPVDTFGSDAAAHTDKDGRFIISAKLKDSVEVHIQNDEFYQRFQLPEFPSSNQLAGLLWKLSEKKSKGGQADPK